MHSFTRYPLYNSLTIMLLLVLSFAPAMAAWKEDEPLTYEGKPLLGSSGNVRMAWNPIANRIGLAYIEVGGVVAYAEWQHGVGVVVKETVGAAGVACLGLVYDANGLPRIGVLGTPNIVEYVKQAGGAWAANDTGEKTVANIQRGSYAWNPATGAGAFMVATGADLPRKQATYLYYQDGGWRTANYGYGGIGGSSLVFTGKGTPFVAWCNDIPPTQEEGVAMTRHAGEATPGAAKLQEISTGMVYMYLFQGTLAVDPAGEDVWVTYIDKDWGIYGRKWAGAGWSAPEVIDLNSQMNGGQLGFAISPAGDRAAMYPTADAIMGTGSTGGITMAYRNHAGGSWKTETMPFLGDPAGLDLAYDPDGNLYGLYNGLNDDQFHLLSGYESPAPLYVKVKMNGQTEPCVIHISGLNYKGAGLPNCNIWEDGMRVDEQYTRFPEEGPRYLQGNEESPWIDLSPLNLSPAGENRVQFFAMQQYPAGYGKYGLPAANFTLSFSSTPSEDGLLKTVTRSGSGSGVMVCIDLIKRKEIKDDLDWSRWQNETARALPPTPGRRPTKFPITTQCVIPSGYYRPETVNNEMNTLIRLGFNGLNLPYVSNYDPV